MLALAIPLKLTRGTPEAPPAESPLHRLQHALRKPVALVIVPVFGFANAGVSFAGVSASLFSEPLTMGVAVGLLLGKLIGAPGVVVLLVRLGVANLSAMATWGQMTAQSLPA